MIEDGRQNEVVENLCGGLAQGCWITDSTLVKWGHAVLRCVSICDALKDLTGIHSRTSDLRGRTRARGRIDNEIFVQWLEADLLFSFGENYLLVKKKMDWMSRNVSKVTGHPVYINQ